jgi:hypothetical protein
MIPPAFLFSSGLLWIFRVSYGPVRISELFLSMKDATEIFDRD